MATKPSSLDVIDSQLTSDDAMDYNQKLSKLEEDSKEYWRFEIVPGIFKQSMKETDETKFNYLDEHFGIIPTWKGINEQLEKLNSNRKSNESYKLLFLARHGQGYHNLAHAKYGNAKWNNYWSKLYGDGEITWGPDPLLTDLGIAQAKQNQQQWKTEITENGAPLPTKWFVSPLSRSIDTLINTWNGIVDLKEVKPYIQEDLRETIGIHTCDKRSPRSVIKEKYEPKGFVIEPGFEEEDIYYKPDYRETVAEQAIRINGSLQDIFNATEDFVISITSHSGSIRAQLLVLGHRPFAVGTGGMVPVFVKATKYFN